MEQIRPFPPTDLIDQAEEEEAIRLAPAIELKEWVVKNWLTLGGELHNPDHDHIAELLHDDETFLAFAWASSACVAKKRMVLGQCEKVMFNQGGWKKARQEQQMRDWFGFVPQYLITVDATFCEQTSDREFCRLIEHELYHIGVCDGEGWAVMNIEQKYMLFIMSYKSVFKREPHPEFSTPEWRFVAKHGFSCSKSEIEDKEQHQHSNTAWLMFQFGLNAKQNLKSLEKTHATSYLP